MASRTLTELHVGRPLRTGGVTIVPLERRRVTVSSDGRRIYANGRQEAEAIVVVDAGGARALDAEGMPIDLETLVTNVAGLRQML